MIYTELKMKKPFQLLAAAAAAMWLLISACDATPLINHRQGDRDAQIITEDGEEWADEEDDSAADNDKEPPDIYEEMASEEAANEKEDWTEVAEELDEIPFEFDVKEEDFKPEAEAEPEEAEEIFTPDGGCCGEGLPPCEPDYFCAYWNTSGWRCSKFCYYLD